MIFVFLGLFNNRGRLLGSLGGLSKLLGSFDLFRFRHTWLLLGVLGEF